MLYNTNRMGVFMDRVLKRIFGHSWEGRPELAKCAVRFTASVMQQIVLLCIVLL